MIFPSLFSGIELILELMCLVLCRPGFLNFGVGRLAMLDLLIIAFISRFQIHRFKLHSHNTINRTKLSQKRDGNLPFFRYLLLVSRKRWR